MPHHEEFADIKSLPCPREAKDNENQVFDFIGEEYSPDGLTEQNQSNREFSETQKFSKTMNPLSIP